MINKDGGGKFLDFMRGTQSSWGSPQSSPPPTSESPERCQDKNEGSLFLQQELKFFSQIYQGQA